MLPRSGGRPLLAVVADGVGGEAGGELASAAAVDAIVARWSEWRAADAPSEDDVERRLRRAGGSADGAVRALADVDPRLARAATTLTAVAVLGGVAGVRAIVLHAGDSRAYSIDARGSLTRLTTDHAERNVVTRFLGQSGGCAFDVGSAALERDGSLLRITIAKPERRNAFDAGMIAELHEAFADVGDARAVVLAGDGPSFSAGADVDWQRSAIDLGFDENVQDALRLYRMLEAIESCPAPVVARIQGYALGGGSGLTACADIAVAAPDATFGFTEVRLGIIPAVISPFVFAKIGAQARRYFLTGERFDAQTALRIGLVSEVAEDLDGAVERVAAELLQSGPEATRAAKRLVRAGPASGEELARIAAGLRAGAEGQEGLRAFLDKRNPSWTV